jgi:hypothetical protein
MPRSTAATLVRGGESDDPDRLFVSLCAILLGLAAPSGRRNWQPPRTGDHHARGSRHGSPLTRGACSHRAAAGAARRPSDAARHVRRLHRRRAHGIERAHPVRRRRRHYRHRTWRSSSTRSAPASASSAGTPLVRSGRGGARPAAANDLNFQQLYLESEYKVVDRISVLGQVADPMAAATAFIAGVGRRSRSKRNRRHPRGRQGRVR